MLPAHPSCYHLSTIFNSIDFFRDADIGGLVIFHHDPMASDPQVPRLFTDAKRYTELVAPTASGSSRRRARDSPGNLPGR